MINTEDLIDLLKNKLPSISLLSGYKTVDNLGLSNRNNLTTLTCSLSNNEFFKFLEKNNIPISNRMKSYFTNIKDIAFDIESLFTKEYRLYVPKSAITLFSLWDYAKKYPLESVNIERLKPNLDNALETINRVNRYEKWLKLVDISEVDYPIVIVKDSLGTYSTVDGRHRVQKLINENVKTVNAYVIPAAEFAPIYHPRDRVIYFLENNSLLNNSDINFKTELMQQIIEKNSVISAQINWENLLAIGMYYNSEIEKITTWKFYIKQRQGKEETTSIFQHKFENNPNNKNYKGTYVEQTYNGTELFNDQLNIIGDLKSLGEVYLASSKREDVNQTYLRIGL